MEKQLLTAYLSSQHVENHKSPASDIKDTIPQYWMDPGVDQTPLGSGPVYYPAQVVFLPAAMMRSVN